MHEPLRVVLIVDGDDSLLERADDRLARIEGVAVVAAVDSLHHLWRLAGRVDCDVWATALPAYVPVCRQDELLAGLGAGLDSLAVMTDRVSRTPDSHTRTPTAERSLVSLDSSDELLRHCLWTAAASRRDPVIVACHWGLPGAA